MAVLTIPNLKIEVNTKINTNGTFAITGAIHNQVWIDTIDSLIDYLNVHDATGVEFTPTATNPALVGNAPSTLWVNSNDGDKLYFGASPITSPYQVLFTDGQIVPADQEGNTIDAGSVRSTVSGGKDNNIIDSSTYSSIAGGRANYIKLASTYSFIGGGWKNTIDNSDYSAIVGGGGSAVGSLNHIINTDRGFIGAGWKNEISASDDASVLGGSNNKIQVGSSCAVISGGCDNLINASDRAVIAGGKNNQILGSDLCYITGGDNNQIIGNGIDDESPRWCLVGGRSGRVEGYQEESNIINGHNGVIDSLGALDVSIHNVIMTGLDNKILGLGLNNTVLNGFNNVIENPEDTDLHRENTIINGQRNTIKNSNGSTIVSGDDNTIDGLDRVTLIGVLNKTISSIATLNRDDTTYVNGLCITGAWAGGTHTKAIGIDDNGYLISLSTVADTGGSVPISSLTNIRIDNGIVVSVS